MRRLAIALFLMPLAGTLSTFALANDKADCHWGGDQRIRACNAVIAKEPNYAPWFLYRAIGYERQGNKDRAIADYSEAIRLDPRYAPAFHARGKIYEAMGDYSRALADYTEASAILPSFTDFSSAVERVKRSIAAASPSIAAPIAAAPASPGIAAQTPVSAPTTASSVSSVRRVALVIGNSAYQSVPVLANPSRDATAIAETLRKVGFQSVTLVTDVSHDRLIQALRAFALEADKADWATIYYAGHGIEINGVNYLIPIDAKLATDRDVQFEAIPLDQVMSATEGTKKLRLVVLDACRDNPFVNKIKRTVASRSIGRGLARVEPDVGMLVVFAARDGQVALDGDDGNSPFTLAFIKNVMTPGIEINKLFRLVRDDVMAATGRKQQPFSYGSIPGAEDFYFVVN